jgi:seryl-tRNA synthetase
VLDLKLIRDNPEALQQALIKRGQPAGDVEKLLESIRNCDSRRRFHTMALQEAQTRRNALSKEVGKAKGAGREEDAQALMAEVAGLKEVIAAAERDEKDCAAKLEDLLAGIPNIPAEDVPVGGEEANTEIRRWGTPREFGFAAKQHFELGEALGLMDFETAAKLSGSRFVVLKGALARMERALAAFMLDLHTGGFGYEEINPPLILNDYVLFGTAQLPKFRSDQYTANREIGEIAYEKGQLTASGFEVTGPLSEDEQAVLCEAKKLGALPRPVQTRSGSDWSSVRWRFESRQWLLPTAEVPLTNLVQETTIDSAILPLRVTAHTPCFRSEAGAAGKDTRGMIRLHQFSKVELVSITTPEQSAAEHERMTSCAEEVLKRLGLPFRTIVLATGDMGFSATKTYDIEVWLPGQNAYREISSCSNCGDFQARRMSARYRPKGGKDLRFVHTLNGSGLAVGRTLIAVLENYQEADGSIRIPEALAPYMGGMEIIPAR